MSAADKRRSAAARDCHDIRDLTAMRPDIDLKRYVYEGLGMVSEEMKAEAEAEARRKEADLLAAQEEKKRKADEAHAQHVEALKSSVPKKPRHLMTPWEQHLASRVEGSQ